MPGNNVLFCGSFSIDANVNFNMCAVMNQIITDMVRHHELTGPPSPITLTLIIKHNCNFPHLVLVFLYAYAFAGFLNFASVS
jgi:hypothetical protein